MQSEAEIQQTARGKTGGRRGRPRNDGRLPGTGPGEVYLNAETGEIAQRPRGRPSNLFLATHRKVEIPLGVDAETYVRDLLRREKASKKSGARAGKAVKPAMPTSEPVQASDAREPAAPEPAAPESVVPEASADQPRPAQRAADLLAGVAGEPRADEAGPSLALQGAAAELLSESVRQRETRSDAKLIEMLRSRLEEVIQQRDRWRQALVEEIAQHQAEVARLHRQIDELFDMRTSDIQALRLEMQASRGGV